MARKFPNMPGGGQNKNMMKQIQKMQQDMLNLQQEMEERTFTSTAGGGVVTATVTGKKVLTSVEIKPEAVDPDDVEMLQDLIVAAVNEAIRIAETTMEDEMARITGGMSIPGLF
ncbi:MAG: YbaB/EbfC family nucleoid-associated protein [Eubacteriales bacterium]|jgi:DNA-binding YbaB/EbfC family protein